VKLLQPLISVLMKRLQTINKYPAATMVKLTIKRNVRIKAIPLLSVINEFIESL